MSHGLIGRLVRELAEAVGCTIEEARALIKSWLDAPGAPDLNPDMDVRDKMGK